MTKVFHAQAGKVAIWEKEGLSDPMAPFYNPTEHMDRVFFHSDLFYLASVLVTEVTVEHPALAGIVGTGQVGVGAGSAEPIGNGDTRGLSIDLVTHNFGYAPPVFILTEEGEILSGGTVIQSTGGMIRYGSSWSDTVKAGIFEAAISGAVALPAITKTYKVFCFRNMSGDPSLPTLRLSKPDGDIILGRKITQDARPMRAPSLPEDAEFYVPLDPVLDVRNGAIRTISPISGTNDVGIYTGSFFSLRSVLMGYL